MPQTNHVFLFVFLQVVFSADEASSSVKEVPFSSLKTSVKYIFLQIHS